MPINITLVPWYYAMSNNYKGIELDIQDTIKIKWLNNFLNDTLIIINKDNTYFFKYRRFWWHFWPNLITTILNYYIDLWGMNDWQLLCDLPNNIYCDLKNGVLGKKFRSCENINIIYVDKIIKVPI